MNVKTKSLKEGFIIYLSSIRRYSPCTIREYQSILRKVHCTNRWCRSMNVEKARDLVLQFSEEGLSPATINRYLSMLRVLFLYLQKINVVDTNPFRAIPSLKKEKKIPKFLVSSEISKLTSFNWSDSIKDKQDKLCLNFMLNYGLRVSEVCSLKVSSLDLLRQVINIRNGKGNKDRCIPMIPCDIGQFRRIAISYPKDCKVFPERLSTASKIRYMVKQRINQICCKQGISPHVLRHSFATMLINNGCPIQIIKSLLWHSSVATTQMYAQVTIGKLKSDYKAAFVRN